MSGINTTVCSAILKHPNAVFRGLFFVNQISHRDPTNGIYVTSICCLSVPFHSLLHISWNCTAPFTHPSQMSRSTRISISIRILKPLDSVLNIKPPKLGIFVYVS